MTIMTFVFCFLVSLVFHILRGAFVLAQHLTWGLLTCFPPVTDPCGAITVLRGSHKTQTLIYTFLTCCRYCPRPALYSIYSTSATRLTHVGVCPDNKVQTVLCSLLCIFRYVSCIFFFFFNRWIVNVTFVPVPGRRKRVSIATQSLSAYITHIALYLSYTPR